MTPRGGGRSGRGQWEDSPRLTESALVDWLGQQEDRVEELMDRLEWKQREITRVAEVEGDERNPSEDQSNQGSPPSLHLGPEVSDQMEEGWLVGGFPKGERESLGRRPIPKRAQERSDDQGRFSTPVDEGLREERGPTGRDWIQAGGGPPTQKPPTKRSSSGGQQGHGEGRGDLGEEAPRTEQYQTVFLRTKLSCIVRALQMEDHEMEKPLERDRPRQEEREHQGVMPFKTDDQQEGRGPFLRTEIKDRTSQGLLGSTPFTAFDPDSPKGGRARAEERGY